MGLATLAGWLFVRLTDKLAGREEAATMRTRDLQAWELADGDSVDFRLVVTDKHGRVKGHTTIGAVTAAVWTRTNRQRRDEQQAQERRRQ